MHSSRNNPDGKLEIVGLFCVYEKMNHTVALEIGARFWYLLLFSFDYNTTALLSAGRLYWGVQKFSRIKNNTSVEFPRRGISGTFNSVKLKKL